MTEIDDNIFANGVLLQFETSGWKGIRKMTMAELSRVSRYGNESWLGAHKKLINPRPIKAVWAKVNACRQWIKRHSLPFEIRGVHFIPRDLIEDVDSYLNAERRAWLALVEQLCFDFQTHIDQARTDLPQHIFNTSDYPTDLRSKFAFSWRFITMSAPTRDGYTTSVLSPELYARERDKFINQMSQARESMQTALRVEFAKLVTNMAERFEPDIDKPQGKVFQDTLVTNFTEYFESFRARNVFDDNGLAELVGHAQDMLAGVSPQDVRDDNELKESLRSDLQRLESLIASNIVDRPARLLRVPDSPDSPQPVYEGADSNGTGRMLRL